MSTVPQQNPAPERKKITIRTLLAKKQRGEPITMLTAYDFPTSLALDQAGVDAILVGDSLGMVVLGYDNTLPVTMEDMLHHCKAVARGARAALLIGDLPFMSYQASIRQAVRNAGRFLQVARMDAVKLEGGRERRRTVRAIVQAGIPVMGHLGLTPQSVNLLGGFRPQGKTAAAAQRLIEDALILQEAGCFAIVLEALPARLAEFLSRKLEIPTIGIGAGAGCDGQVLVVHDLLGMFERTPKFARQYTCLRQDMMQAFQAYIQDVQAHAFPAPEHTIEMPDAEWQTLLEQLSDA
jgi:3-methyl-2-oxobutanoate hydroxymethyltransferase